MKAAINQGAFFAENGSLLELSCTRSYSKWFCCSEISVGAGRIYAQLSGGHELQKLKMNWVNDSKQVIWPKTDFYVTNGFNLTLVFYDYQTAYASVNWAN